MIYTVTLNPSVDYIMHLKTMIPGRTNRSAREELRFGGKGINVSCVLRELGVESVALGFAAGFTGHAIEEYLRTCGIETRFIHLTEGNSRINVKILSDSETEINGQGPEIPADAFHALLKQIAALREGDTLVLAGSIPAGLPENTYEHIMRTVAHKRIRCAVDTSGQSLFQALPCRPFVIKPNRQELEQLFSVQIHSVDEVIPYGRRLQEAGAVNVIISLGEDGAVLLDENGGIHRQPAIPCQTVSTVGAGDSMLAGFLAGYAETGDYGKALTLGAVCGAATAGLPGLATQEKITELASK